MDAIVNLTDESMYCINVRSVLYSFISVCVFILFKSLDSSEGLAFSVKE